MTMNNVDIRVFFETALKAALPEGKFIDLPDPPAGRTIVLGAGKAAGSMAAAFEQAWGIHAPHVPLEGLVVTRYGHGRNTEFIEVVEAAHPVPDHAGQAAAQRILALAAGATRDDLVIFLISGGASALLSAPAAGIAFSTKQALNSAILKSGMSISEMNMVRKALSAIKGGRLAIAAAPARQVSYLISDVPGDDPGTIGSGPSVVEQHDVEGALQLLARYQIDIAEDTRLAIARNISKAPVPTGELHMLATPQLALEAAAETARDAGMACHILGDAIEGEAREVAQVFAGICRQVIHKNQPFTKPCLLLSGGETTVTVRGSGRGGRNAEFLLAFVLAMEPVTQPWQALAADTDGIDGIEDNAGVIADQETLAKAQKLGLDPVAMLDNNDAHSLFDRLDQLIVTGPTLTNVNDFRAIYLN